MLFKPLSHTRESNRYTVVLGESGTSTEKPNDTSQGWPASRSSEAFALRLGYGALAPAPKAFGAGAGDDARTRDVHLGKVEVYIGDVTAAV